MTTYYYDSSAPDGGNGLTEETAFNDLQSGTITQDNVFYLKRGSQFDTTRWLFANKASCVIDAYGSGPLPIVRVFQTSDTAGDWTETSSGSNIWEFDTPDNSVGTIHRVLGFGYSNGDATVPGANVDYYNHPNSGGSVDTFTEFGQWAWDDGAGDAPRSKLAVYCDGNPVTVYGNVIFQKEIFAGIQFDASSGSIRNIRFEYCHHAISGRCINKSAHYTPVVQNCEFYRCQKGIHLISTGSFGFEDHQIDNNTFDEMYDTSVDYRSILAGGFFEYNKVTNSGLTVSTGAIRFADAQGVSGNEPTIRYNTVDGYTFGNYFSVDGSGIYIDNDSDGVNVYGNVIKNIAAGGYGIQDNAGAARTKYYSNIVDGASIGMRYSNSAGGDTFSSELYNNLFINVKTGLRLNQGVDLGTIVAKNNIFVSDGSPESAAVFISGAADVVPTEQYNCFYGFQTANENHTFGTGTITTDPKLSGYRTAWDSPCLSEGDDSVLPLADFRGSSFDDPPNMGAYTGFTDGYNGTTPVTVSTDLSEDAALPLFEEVTVSTLVN